MNVRAFLGRDVGRDNYFSLIFIIICHCINDVTVIVIIVLLLYLLLLLLFLFLSFYSRCSNENIIISPITILVSECRLVCDQVVAVSNGDRFFYDRSNHHANISSQCQCLGHRLPDRPPRTLGRVHIFRVTFYAPRCLSIF